MPDPSQLPTLSLPTSPPADQPKYPRTSKRTVYTFQHDHAHRTDIVHDKDTILIGGVDVPDHQFQSFIEYLKGIAEENGL